MSKLIDLSNQTFGYWKVLRRGTNRNGQAYWLCKCTACGQEKEVAGTHLRAGRSTNCGCIRMKKMQQANIKDETGKDFGFLHVERMASKEERPRQDRTGVYWICTCKKCGKQNVVVFGDYLRKGETQSCGCLNSKNESLICQMLDREHIEYVQQKTFDKLTSDKNNSKLFFDIAIYNQGAYLYLIEYDGIQHFEKGHFKNTFDQTHKNDLKKNKFCFKNNIPLIRIPYDAKYTIDDLKLKTTRFLLTPENEMQYYNRI